MREEDRGATTAASTAQDGWEEGDASSESEPSEDEKCGSGAVSWMGPHGKVQLGESGGACSGPLQMAWLLETILRRISSSLGG